MQTLRVTNSTPKTLRITSCKGLAAARGLEIAPGATDDLALQPTGEPSDFANIALVSNTNQFVLAWWTVDGAKALAKSTDGSPARLGCAVEILGEVCLLTITAAATTFTFSVAPGHPATLVVPPTTWSIREVLERFQDVVDDQELLLRGQFVWSARFLFEIMERWRRIIGAEGNEAAATALAPLGNVEVELARAIQHYDDRTFESVRMHALQALQSAGAARHGGLFDMLGPGDHGREIYARATARFRAGGTLKPATSGQDVDPVYAAVFQNPTKLTFATLRGLHKKCAVECYGWAEAINAHIDNRTLGAGLRGIKIAGHVHASPMDMSYSVRRYQPAPNAAPVLPQGAGDILVYNTNLGGQTGDACTDGPIFALMQNLDRGLLVAAYCESGQRLDQAGDTNNPLEHWLLILAYERTAYGAKFVFWDPDASTSARMGEVEGLRPVTIVNPFDHNKSSEVPLTGFGLLHFVAAGAVAVHAELPRAGLPELFAKTGRFSTEAKNGGILVGSDGYHMNIVGPWGICGEPLHAQHRYQVGALRPFATGGA